MSGDSYLLAAPDWLLPAAVAVACAAILVVWGYGRQPVSLSLRILAAGLKVVGIAALAFCLLEPMRAGQRPRPKANLLPILVDNSQSMGIDPAGDGADRTAELAELLDSSSGWRTRLEQDFDVRSYAFDARLRSVDDLQSLTFDGQASSLGASMETIAARFQKRPVAGVLLFSDGNVTDPGDAGRDWARLGFPVYPVVSDARDEPKDLRIESVAVAQSDFEAAPVTIDARLAASRMPGQQTVVQLIAEDGSAIEEQTVTLQGPGQTADVRFRFRPPQSGVQFLRLTAFPASQRRAIERGEAGDEATAVNNTRLVMVDRPQGPFRVLYVSGRPNWEFKFLRRALAEDAEVQLTGLVRIARRQPKFSFRDQGVQSTNPLFAGLGGDEEEAAEQYDEPVIIRLGVDEADELSSGFPTDAEELFGYHAVLLDDVEADFFTPDQLLLLRRFVSLRGGGLMMLGGQESFAKGGYQKTPVGEMLPVYLESRSAAAQRVSTANGNQTAGEVRLRLTREGMLQPWLRLRNTETAEADRLDQMPTFRVVNRTRDVKPGATVLAVAETSAGDSLPALVAQRFGKGRAAALCVGDLWRWSMRRDPKAEEEPFQAWRQLVRWIVSDVPRNVELDLQDADVPGRPVTIRVQVRDEAFMPLDNASVSITVTSPSGSEVQLAAVPDNRQGGLYATTFWSSEAGGFRAIAEVAGADGSSLGRDTAGWAAQPAAAEFQRLTQNRALLQQIAESTGGELVEENDLDAFVSSLPGRKVPVTERWVYPIWHRPWMLIFAIGCLCGEWGLRRWKGLP